MHLLVLSDSTTGTRRHSQVLVSIHLLVLGAFRLTTESVSIRQSSRLNAPSGAWCFPTRRNARSEASPKVSMHLLVLGAFRLRPATLATPSVTWSQCTFWCLVLSDRSWGSPPFSLWPFQCTFWCLVLSDRSSSRWETFRRCIGLNAPSGAWCFPTRKRPLALALDRPVSMHLLVLGAFRLYPQKTAPQRRLPKRNRCRPRKHRIRPARTAPIKPHNRRKPPQTTPAPPTPLPTSTPPASNKPKPKNHHLAPSP